MSAERLREAARVLRERADAARAGRWETRPSRIVDGVTLVVAPRTHGVERVAACSGSLPHGNSLNATYIATMHPGVGLALADWLDDIYGRITDTDYDEDEDLTLALAGQGDTSEWPDIHRALAVADAILGGAA